MKENVTCNIIINENIDKVLVKMKNDFIYNGGPHENFYYGEKLSHRIQWAKIRKKCNIKII